MQKKSHSLLETVVGTGIGWMIAFVMNILVLRGFGFEVGLHQNFWITNIFTVISLVRGYYVRRLFNLLHVRGIL